MKTLILLAGLILFSANVYCKVYKWTDANGRVRYGDNKPESIKSQTLEIKENVYESPDIVSRPSEKVIMYSTSWCGYCKKARKYFRKNNIPYIDYDIEKDSSAKQRYDKLGGNGVPLIRYKDKNMTGFSASRFERFYN